MAVAKRQSPRCLRQRRSLSHQSQLQPRRSQRQKRAWAFSMPPSAYRSILTRQPWRLRQLRLDVDDFESATEIGTSSSVSFVDRHNRGGGFYYWVQWETNDGQACPPAAGHVAQQDVSRPPQRPPAPPPTAGTTRLELLEQGEVEVASEHDNRIINGIPVRVPVSNRQAFKDWGIWGTSGGSVLFRAFLSGEKVFTFADGETIGDYYANLDGERTGSNPTAGSAVWIGAVRAVDQTFGVGIAISGDARLEVDLSTATIDVDFTNFTQVNEGYTDISWLDLALVNGAFDDDTIHGAFYGDRHEGAAGRFSRDRLGGVFGAIRTN